MTVSDGVAPAVPAPPTGKSNRSAAGGARAAPQSAHLSYLHTLVTGTSQAHHGPRGRVREGRSTDERRRHRPAVRETPATRRQPAAADRRRDDVLRRAQRRHPHLPARPRPPTRRAPGASSTIWSIPGRTNGSDGEGRHEHRSLRSPPPTATGCRSAAAASTATLHELAPDVVLLHDPFWTPRGQPRRARLRRGGDRRAPLLRVAARRRPAGSRCRLRPRAAALVSPRLRSTSTPSCRSSTPRSTSRGRRGRGWGPSSATPRRPSESCARWSSPPTAHGYREHYNPLGGRGLAARGVRVCHAARSIFSQNAGAMAAKPSAAARIMSRELANDARRGPGRRMTTTRSPLSTSAPTPGGWWSSPTGPDRLVVEATDELYETVRIGAGLAASGRLSDEAMARGMETLAVFARFCRANRLAPRDVHVVATSAIRDAANGEQFLADAQRATGLRSRRCRRRTRRASATSPRSTHDADRRCRARHRRRQPCS